MRKKILLVLSVVFVISGAARADEGMWLPSLISQRIDDMRAHGFKLTAEDIYSINQASLKDAVVLFGGGCTGEMVSPEGLLFTNHHCGYYQVQRHSSVEHDYLKDGFWALDRKDELTCPGLSVSFLDRMEDVTELVLKDCKEDMSETMRDSLVARACKKIEEDAVGGRAGCKAKVETFYYANQYFLFVYRVYTDVRLVGAPPSSIGKFGGDTDNWMWPRHTGDFSIFRVYAGADNNPSEISESNVPYKPRRFFHLSTRGVREGDFTMIYGFPGRTKEYVTSDEVVRTMKTVDPTVIALRTLRLDIQKKYMDSSQAVRIMYSAKNASTSNAWKKMQGEVRGLARLGTLEQKKAFEMEFSQWATGGPYESALPELKALYEELEPYSLAATVYQESAGTIELTKFASGYVKEKKEEKLASFRKSYYEPIDRECFIAVMGEFDKRLGQNWKPSYFNDKLAHFGSIEAWAEEIWSDVTLEKAAEFNDEMSRWYKESISPKVSELNSRINVAYRKYMKGRMEFEKGRQFYPDANLTLRVAYGQVRGYSPSDGIYFKPVSTLKGIMEKDNPEVFDYNIPQSLRNLYAAGTFEDQPVCFIATNHTTGGNSGSPVLNCDGDLVGLNFDRVWEGTMSDIVFDPDFCRNICLDIRYLLFVVDKVCGAGCILDECVIVD